MRAFKVGELVKLAPGAEHFMGRADSLCGTVVAYTPGPGTRLRVKVRRDGLKGAEWYHRDFWRPAPRGAKGER